MFVMYGTYVTILTSSSIDKKKTTGNTLDDLSAIQIFILFSSKICINFFTNHWL